MKSIETAKRVVVVIGALSVIWGCDSAEMVAHPEGEEAWNMAHGEQPPEEVVARVDGHPITVADMEAFWRNHPDLTVEQVRDRLVQREILAREAKDRGYQERPEVAFARKQGMVSALLADEIEAKAEPDESQREELLEYVFDTRRAPPGLRASHLLVVVPDEVEDESGETIPLRGEDREPYYEQGREYIQEAQRRLNEGGRSQTMRAVAEELNRDVLEAPFEAVVDKHLRFPRAGERYDSEHLPARWTTVVSSFAEGAETVAGEDRLGTVSEPVRTRFGWHLIKVKEVIPEQRVDTQSAEAFVDFELQVGARRKLFRETMESWSQDVDAELYPERLGSAFEEQGM